LFYKISASQTKIVGKISAKYWHDLIEPCLLVLPLLNLETNMIIPRGRKKPVSCTGHNTSNFGLHYKRDHLEKTVHTQPHLGTQGLNLAEQTSVRKKSWSTVPTAKSEINHTWNARATLHI
jgi:hypothetical protein